MASSTNGAKTFSKVSEVFSLGVPQLLPRRDIPGRRRSRRAFDQTTLPNAASTELRANGANERVSVRVRRHRRRPARRLLAAHSAAERAARRDQVRPNHVRHAQRQQLVGVQRRSTTMLVPGTSSSRPSPARAREPRRSGTTSAATSRSRPPLLPWVFFPFIIEPMTPPPTHTIDVRAVQTDAAGVFQPGSSIQVSKYPLAYDTATAAVRAAAVQLPQLCPVRRGDGAVPRGLPRGRAEESCSRRRSAPTPRVRR